MGLGLRAINRVAGQLRSMLGPRDAHVGAAPTEACRTVAFSHRRRAMAGGQGGMAGVQGSLANRQDWVSGTPVEH